MNEQTQEEKDKAAANRVAAEQKEKDDLKAQIANLNKGIAAYRDEAGNASKTAKELKSELEAIKTILAKKEDNVILTADEETKFKAFAKKNGLVTKDEMNAQAAKKQNEDFKSIENEAVSEFLKKNPEFDDDAEWKKVIKEFALYRVPTTLAGYKALLEKIRKEIKGETGKSESKVRAEIINKGRLGLGGGSQKTNEEEYEEEIERLTKRYPNLSKDQIEARIAETRSLFTKKK